MTFKCNCGATVNLKVWIENDLVAFYARCWKCDKELNYYEETILIDMAVFDFMEHYIEKFKRDFNSDRKQKTIRVVK